MSPRAPLLFTISTMRCTSAANGPHAYDACEREEGRTDIPIWRRSHRAKGTTSSGLSTSIDRDVLRPSTMRPKNESALCDFVRSMLSAWAGVSIEITGHPMLSGVPRRRSSNCGHDRTSICD